MAADSAPPRRVGAAAREEGIASYQLGATGTPNASFTVASSAPHRPHDGKRDAKELWDAARAHLGLRGSQGGWTTFGAFLMRRARSLPVMERAAEEERIDYEQATGVSSNSTAFNNILSREAARAYGRARHAFDWAHLTPSERRLRELMVHPESNFRSGWDACQVFVLLYLSIVVPYRVGFSISSAGWTYLVDFLIDLYFLFDIFLGFVTGYISEPAGDVVMTPKYVAQRYLRTWFTLDVVASAPVDSIVRLIEGRFVCSWDMPRGSCPPGGGEVPAGQLLRFLRFARLARLMKLLRLARISRILQRYEDRAVNFARFMTFGRIVFVLFFLGHSLGCLFFYFSGRVWRSDEEDLTYEQDNGWFVWDDVDLSYASSRMNTEAYIAAVYWAFQTVTTVGYGDITPITLSERIVSTVAMVAGSLMFSVMMSSIFNAMNPDSVKARNAVLIDAVTNFAKVNQMPRKLAARVRQYYRMQSYDNVDDRRVIVGLSHELRVDVLRTLYTPFLRENPLIDQLVEKDDEALRLVVSYALPTTVPQASAVYIRGEAADHVYCLYRGQIEIIDDRILDEDSQGSLIEELLDVAEPPVLAVFDEGSYFGEGGLLGMKRRTETVRARSASVTLLQLPCDIVSDVLSRNESKFAIVRGIFMERLKRFGSARDKEAAVKKLVFNGKLAPTAYGALSDRQASFDEQFGSNIGKNAYLGDHHPELSRKVHEGSERSVRARISWATAMLGATARRTVAMAKGALGMEHDTGPKNPNDSEGTIRNSTDSNDPDKTNDAETGLSTRGNDTAEKARGQAKKSSVHFGDIAQRAGESANLKAGAQHASDGAAPIASAMKNAPRRSRQPSLFRTPSTTGGYIRSLADDLTEDISPFHPVRAFVLGRKIPGRTSGNPDQQEYGELRPLDGAKTITDPGTHESSSDGGGQYEYIVLPDVRAPKASKAVRAALAQLGVALAMDGQHPQDLQSLLGRKQGSRDE